PPALPPVPTRAPAPPPAPPPVPAQADIELKAKQEAAKKEQAQRAAEEKAKQEAKRQAEQQAKALASLQAQAQRELATRQDAERDARLRRQADAESRMRAQAEQEAQTRAQQAAAATAQSRAEADWIDRIRSKIRSNVNLPPEISGNPEAVFDVVQLPTGEVLSVRIQKSSGIPAYDDAVQRALVKSSQLPPPQRPDLFQRELVLRFHPHEPLSARSAARAAVENLHRHPGPVRALLDDLPKRDRIDGPAGGEYEAPPLAILVRRHDQRACRQRLVGTRWRRQIDRVEARTEILRIEPADLDTEIATRIALRMQADGDDALGDHRKPRLDLVADELVDAAHDAEHPLLAVRLADRNQRAQHQRLADAPARADAQPRNAAVADLPQRRREARETAGERIGLVVGGGWDVRSAGDGEHLDLVGRRLGS